MLIILVIINRAKELQPFSLDDRSSIPREFPFVSNIRYSIDKRHYISQPSANICQHFGYGDARSASIVCSARRTTRVPLTYFSIKHPRLRVKVFRGQRQPQSL